MMSKSTFKFDKTVFSIGTHAELKAAERAFWHSKTPLERLEATELMRQAAYGYDPLTARIPRVLTVISLKETQESKEEARIGQAQASDAVAKICRYSAAH